MVCVEREELRPLVDELPENEMKAACRHLEFIRDVGKDPVRWALENASLDDEPLTDEDFRTGRTTSMYKPKRELGL